jgi:hypothetical protein
VQNLQKHKPAIVVPAPAICDLAVAKLPVAVQDVPLYIFVFAVLPGILPPKANAAV